MQILAAFGVWIGIVPSVGAAPLELGLGLAMGRVDSRTVGSPSSPLHMRSLRPLVRYAGSVGNWSLEARAERRFEIQSGARFESAGGSGDETTDRALLDLKRRWSPFDEIHGQGAYARTHNALDADPDALVANGTVIRASGELGLDRRHFEADARIRSTSYADRPGYETGTSRVLLARVVPVRQRNHSFYGSVQGSRLTVGAASELRSRMATLGIRRRVDPIHSIAIEAGVVGNRFAGASEEQKPTLILALGRTPRRPYALDMELGLSLEGDSLAAYNVEARYLLSTGRLWFRTESLADAQGGTFADPTLVRRFAVGGLDTLGRANVLGAELSYANARTLSGPAERRETLRLNVWVLRRMQPWLTARVGGSWAWEEKQSAPIEQDSRSMRIDAELVVLHSTRQVVSRGELGADRDDVAAKEEA